MGAALDVITPYLFNKFTLGLWLGGLLVIFFQLVMDKVGYHQKVSNAILGEYHRVRKSHIITLIFWPFSVVITTVIDACFDRKDSALKNRHSSD